MRGAARWPGTSRFAITALPGRLLGSVLLIDALAVLLTVVDATRQLADVDGRLALVAALGNTGVLAAATVVHTEVSLRLERFRRRVVLGTANVNLSSVWIFAAALLLPLLLATGVTAVVFLYRALRIRSSKAKPFQQVFTAATHVLAVHAAAGMSAYVHGDALSTLHTPSGLLTLAAAMLAFTVVNTCLVVGAVVMSSNKTVREVLGHGDEILLEVATLSLGGLVALAIAVQPWLVLFALPPLLILHRAVLVKQLQQAANTDGKTGLLNAAAWHEMAGRELERAATTGGSAGVLIFDLDHFKRINDHYGHVAGDMVLQSVAGVLRSHVRGDDLVGRFGGEEFVMLLARDAGHRASYAELRAVAERVRAEVAEMAVSVPTPDGPLTINGITLSAGGAIFPEDGAHLLDLIAVADSGLYAAKRGGRNAIRMGLHQVPPPSEDTAALPELAQD